VTDTAKIKRRAEAEVREQDEQTFANRVHSRVERATFNRGQRESRKARREHNRQLRRREIELERAELRKTFGAELANRIRPRAVYDVFQLPQGSIAFMDDADNPGAYALHERALNENGLAVRGVRRGLHGWRFPGELGGTAVLAIDPSGDELRAIAERHRTVEPRRRRRRMRRG